MSQQKDDFLVHSVTVMSKPLTTSSSPKEEEIVFHFPPPPPMPPPPDCKQAIETFNIVRKNGSLVVSERDKSTVTSQMQQSVTDVKRDDDQRVPQPTPRKSKQSGLRKSASYTNISIPQPPGKGYENVFLDKYQLMSRLQIDSKDLESNNPAEMKVPRSKTNSNKSKPDYVNVKELHIGGSPTLGKRNPVEHSKRTQELTAMNSEVDMSRSCPPGAFKSSPAFVLQEGPDKSNYGKICKIPDGHVRKLIEQKSQEGAAEDHRSRLKPSKRDVSGTTAPDIDDVFSFKSDIQKPNLSAKDVRDIKSDMRKMDDVKRSPSRKLEKAPMAPSLLQKSSSGLIAGKKIPAYVNFPSSRSHLVDEAQVLPAVHENISNSDVSKLALVGNLPRPLTKSAKAPFSLSHSQSDASVFLALKERKAQSLNRGWKLDSNFQFFNNMARPKEAVAASSSDSDGGYERIFFDKPNQKPGKDEKPVLKEEVVLQPSKSNGKEMPVAPPRARRRNTTEIQYAKVKSKGASPLTSALSEESKQIFNHRNSPDPPPAIPMKTKDAFEVPDDRCIKDYRTADGASASFNR